MRTAYWLFYPCCRCNSAFFPWNKKATDECCRRRFLSSALARAIDFMMILFAFILFPQNNSHGRSSPAPRLLCTTESCRHHMLHSRSRALCCPRTPEHAIFFLRVKIFQKEKKRCGAHTLADFHRSIIHGMDLFFPTVTAARRGAVCEWSQMYTSAVKLGLRDYASDSQTRLGTAVTA